MSRDLRGAAVLAAVVFATTSGSMAASDLNGFLRPAGHGDVALSFTHETYDQFWVGEMKVSDPGVGEVKTRSISLWMAYGVTDRLTVFGSLPFVNADSDGAGGFHERDLQDITFLGAYRLLEVGESVRSRLVGALGFRTIASNYEANSPVDIGDGTADWLARLVYQLEYGRFYFSQQVGFDRRGGEAPDGFPLYTEAGVTWGPVTYSAMYQRLEAKDGTDIGDPGFTFPSNEEEFERVGVRAYGRINERLGIGGMYFTTLDGRNTGDATGVSGSVNVSF